MDIQFLIRTLVAISVFASLTTNPIFGQTNKNAGQVESSPSPAKGITEERTPAPRPLEANTVTALTPEAIETTESFSQLTLYLFASGLALFIALLGWSDQIRGIDRDTKELVDRFLENTEIDRKDFLDIVKPESPNKQLIALTQVVTGGRIKTKDTAEVLRTFTASNTEWTQIERLSSLKYNLTIALTIVLFVAGIVSLFTSATQQVRVGSISVRAEMLVLVLPMVVIGLLLIIIICSAHREKKLRSLLDSMSDRI